MRDASLAELALEKISGDAYDRGYLTGLKDGREDGVAQTKRDFRHDAKTEAALPIENDLSFLNLEEGAFNRVRKFVREGEHGFEFGTDRTFWFDNVQNLEWDDLVAVVGFLEDLAGDEE